MHVSTLYDPLRLSCGFRRKVHRKIEALQAESAAGSVSSEGPRAFRPAFTKPSNGGNTRAPPSAFIGFMLSLGYPAQAHANHEYLKKFLREPDQSSCGIAISFLSELRRWRQADRLRGRSRHEADERGLKYRIIRSPSKQMTRRIQIDT